MFKVLVSVLRLQIYWFVCYLDRVAHNLEIV